MMLFLFNVQLRNKYDDDDEVTFGLVDIDSDALFVVNKTYVTSCTSHNRHVRTAAPYAGN